eukprot:352248-Chlamydomonas_euryale.AAC.5
MALLVRWRGQTGRDGRGRGRKKERSALPRDERHRLPSPLSPPPHSLLPSPTTHSSQSTCRRATTDAAQP